MPVDRGSGPVVLLGFDAAAGSDIRPHLNRQPQVSPLAIAPTLLALLDVAPAAAMTESPLREWLTESPALADTGS